MLHLVQTNATNYHGLGEVNNKTVFLTILEPAKSKLKVLADLAPGESSLHKPNSLLKTCLQNAIIWGLGLPHIHVMRTRLSPWQEAKSQSVGDHGSQAEVPEPAATGMVRKEGSPGRGASVSFLCAKAVSSIPGQGTHGVNQ